MKVEDMLNAKNIWQTHDIVGIKAFPKINCSSLGTLHDQTKIIVTKYL